MKKIFFTLLVSVLAFSACKDDSGEAPAPLDPLAVGDVAEHRRVAGDLHLDPPVGQVEGVERMEHVAGVDLAPLHVVGSAVEGENADETTGIKMVLRAIEEPLRQIVANAGGEGAVVVNSVRDGEGDFGYNARTEVFENLFEAGVIDPTKVTRVALENAVSISGMVLTTECVITDIPEETPAPAAPPMGGGMGGMM